MKKELKKAKKQLQKLQKNKRLIIIGLGNPGEKYRETRHNAGFAVIEHISRKFCTTLNKVFLKPVEMGAFSYNEYSIYLVKPLTYMNRSGEIFSYVLKKTGADISDIILICDNMDLEPGMIRLKKKGSSAGHNGIKSVIANLGTSEFKRLYIGVGRDKTGNSVIEHVLGRFGENEAVEFEKAVDNAADALMMLTEKDPDLVMNGINKKKD